MIGWGFLTSASYSAPCLGVLEDHVLFQDEESKASEGHFWTFTIYPNMATAAPETAAPMPSANSNDEPITKAFLESLFLTLREDLQSVRNYLTAEIKEIRRDVDDVGDRVAALEEKSDTAVTESNMLQQEVIR